MTDPPDDEFERAQRIKRLRAGEAESHSRRRRPAVPDEPADREEFDGDVDADVDHEGPVQPGDDLELPPDAPGDLTVASMFLREDLNARLERVEEHLHLRYGFHYDGDLEGPRHVRPLALYLGLLQLEKVDIEEVEALFEEVDLVESPGE